MTEYIYGDVLFIIDFSMDFVCLYIAGKLMHARLKVWRVTAGAALGAVYGVTSLLYSLPTALEISVEVAAAFAVCAAGVWDGRARRLFFGTALFYGASLLLGGAMTLIYYKLGKYRSYFETGGSISTAMGEVPLWVFVLCAVISAALTKGLSLILKRKNEDKTCEISFTLDGKTYETSGLVDSGNTAADPISGTPVVFLSAEFKNMLPSGCDIGANMRGIRAVPISTVDGGDVVFARKPEKFYVKTRGNFEARDALLALGKGDGFDGCGALVPHGLL